MNTSPSTQQPHTPSNPAHEQAWQRYQEAEATALANPGDRAAAVAWSDATRALQLALTQSPRGR